MSEEKSAPFSQGMPRMESEGEQHKSVVEKLFEGAQNAYDLLGLVQRLGIEEQVIQVLLMIVGIPLALIALVLLMAGAGVIVVAVGLVVYVCIVIPVAFAVKLLRRRRMRKIRETLNSFLTKENRVVRKNCRLENLYVKGARLKGEWVEERVQPVVCRSMRTFSALSFQLQAKEGNRLKCVHVTVEQVGKDVAARVDWAASTLTERDNGYDFESEYSIQNDDRKIPIATDLCAQGYGVKGLRLHMFSKSKPCTLPAIVYKGGVQGRWGIKQGMAEVLKIKEERRGRNGSDALCLKCVYAGGMADAEIVWRDPVDDCGEKLGGLNLKKANELVLRARGERGGERVCFFMGGLVGRMVSDSAEECSREISMKKKWRRYRIPLCGVDLTRIKTGFGLRIQDQNGPMAFCIDEIVYRHSWLRTLMDLLKPRRQSVKTDAQNQSETPLRSLCKEGILSTTV